MLRIVPGPTRADWVVLASRWEMGAGESPDGSGEMTVYRGDLWDVLRWVKRETGTSYAASPAT